MGSVPDLFETPRQAGERESLEAFLDLQRAILQRKLAGMSDDDARRSPVPSGTTLLGIVKHLTDVEGWWFRAVFAGERVEFVSTREDPDAHWHVAPDDTVDAIVATYAAEIEACRRAIAGRDLDEPAARMRSQPRTLRWILVHMIEETARHNGHADILRELIDGTTGN